MLNRRGALMAGLSATAAAGAAGCASEPQPPPPKIVSDLGGVIANARDFGIVDGETDQTGRIQDAIDYATTHGLILYIPAGTYRADGLILRDGTRIVGAGPEVSVIRAVPGSDRPALMTIDSGVLRGVLLRGIGLESAVSNGEQHGIHVFARRAGGNDVSGLWHSDFENVRVYNFGGAQIWLEGGGPDARDPIQFLTFKNLELERRNDSARSLGLLMSGQVNQTVWIGGRIDGFGSRGDHPGANVKICRQLTGYDPETDGSTEYASTRSGHTHLFSNVSFQQAQLGVYVDQSSSISFETCHFENLESGLSFVGGGGSRVDRCHFANSATGSNSPFSIKGQDGALVVGSANVFIGQFGDMASVSDDTSAVTLSNPMGNERAVTWNVTKTINADDQIDVGSAKTIVLSGSPTAIRVVQSSHYPGERVVMKAAGGSIFLVAGGNIDFEGASSPIEIVQGGTVTLVRFDKGPDWVIEAMRGARGVRPNP